MLLDEGAEDGELDHVAEVEMSLSGLKIQLHLNLLHLDVAEKLALGRRLANKVVNRVDEADHRLNIRDADIQSFPIGAN